MRDNDLAAMEDYVRRTLHRVPTSRTRQYITKQFKGNRGLRVVFRKLGQSEKEHWLNHFAVAITSPILPPYNRPPFSNNCHTEVVMDICPGCTVRIGTMYKYCEVAEDGTEVWKPGKLFVSEISHGELAKYETLLLPASRQMETRMLCYALRNLDLPFNETAYKLRAIMPCPPGVGYYEPPSEEAEAPPHQPVFCTQLSVLLLQAAAYQHMLEQQSTYLKSRTAPAPDWKSLVGSTHATSHTPNSLYRVLVGTPGVTRACLRPDMSLTRDGKL